MRLRTGNPLCGLREQFAFFCRRAIRSRRQPPSTPFAVAQEDITAAYPPAKPQKIVENFFTGVLETFRALGVEFVSLSEQVDTSTPTGKMVFTVLGAVAELERSLIAERVKAGLRNARAKGTRLGRPKAAVDATRVATLHARGVSWRVICDQLSLKQRDGPARAVGAPQKPFTAQNPHGLALQNR